MISEDLLTLGKHIAQLRIARNLKQSELAYEAGVSERTLQRIEAGNIVKTDGLLKVISHLGRLDAMMAALATASFSPREQMIREATQPAQRSRVRRRNPTTSNNRTSKSSSGKKIIWPEDQP